MLDQKEIAGRLKLARIKRGYRSARSFSIHNKLAESTYAQHESGKRKLNTSTLLSYSKKLSVNPGWILTGQEPILINNDSPQNNDKFLIANFPIISIILKMLVNDINNNFISNYKELNKIVCSVYAEIYQNELDLDIVAGTIKRIINQKEINHCGSNVESTT